MMKRLSALALVLLAGAALASTFSGSAPEARKTPIQPMRKLLDNLAAASEAAYRRTPDAAEKRSVEAQKEVESAIDSITGQRVSLQLKIDSISDNAGRKVATGKMDVKTKPAWNMFEKGDVDFRQHILNDALASKPRNGSIRAMEWYKERVADAQQHYDLEVKKANDQAIGRIPEAIVEIEYDELPPYVNVGAKVDTTGWIRAITISPIKKMDVVYANIRITIAWDAPAKPGEVPPVAATRPAPASAPAPATAPATQPRHLNEKKKKSGTMA